MLTAIRLLQAPLAQLGQVRLQVVPRLQHEWEGVEQCDGGQEAGGSRQQPLLQLHFMFRNSLKQPSRWLGPHPNVADFCQLRLLTPLRFLHRSHLLAAE